VQWSQTVAMRRAGVLELRRIVNDQRSARLANPCYRLVEVRLHHRLGIYTRVTEEAICRFRLSWLDNR